MSAVPPRLTFFVELTSDRLTELFRDGRAADFLADGGHALSMGLLDLSSERAAIVRALEARQVPVTAWLLLDVAEGYWLNADNPDVARRRYEDTIAWAAREGLRLHRVGLDIEFPRNDAELLMRRGVRGVLTLLRRRRTAAQVAHAERAYVQLVEQIRRDGRSVETYHLPFLLDERRAGSTLLRRVSGLVDIPADVEVHMLYASYFGAAGARAYFSEAPAIAVGVTGGGVNADDDSRSGRLLSWDRLEADLLAAAGARGVYIFSLEGCVWHDLLDPLRRMDWNKPSSALPDRALRRAQRKRRLLRLALRAEPLLDLLYPARRATASVDTSNPAAP